MATVYIDAATKQNPYFSVGAAVIKNDSETFEETYILGNIDNNEAEWATLLKTTERLVEFGITHAIIYTDSKIIVDTFGLKKLKNVNKLLLDNLDIKILEEYDENLYEDYYLKIRLIEIIKELKKGLENEEKNISC